MILKIIFIAIVMLIIFWKVFEFSRDRKHAESHKTSHTPSGILAEPKKGKSFSEFIEESWKNHSGVVWSVVLLFLFTTTIYSLHPEVWEAWYENQALFWISQALFILMFAVFHKAKGFFYLLLVAAVSASLWTGFKDELTKKGLITDQTNKAINLHPTQRKWRLSWESLNGRNGSYRAAIKRLDDTLILWQYDPRRKGNFATYIGEKVAKEKYCGTWIQEKPRNKTGNFCLRFVNNFTAANGWTKDHPSHSKRNPPKINLWIEIMQ